MNMKSFFAILFFILVLFLLVFYWFVPYNSINLGSSSNSNFTMNSSIDEDLQFYPNMRFAEKDISYQIENCPLQRKNDMEQAFVLIENNTELEFFPTISNPQIIVTCDEKTKIEGNLFIAGEGGPTNITVAGTFNVIESGKILLLDNSKCERPNVAIHELLHVLGFTHSKNPNNIMYEISECQQTIGEDIVIFLNEIYSIPSEPDLVFENASAFLHGKYLDVNFTLRNDGLKDSGRSVVKLYVDNKVIKEISIPEVQIGYGRKISLANLWVPQVNIEEIKFVIENDFSELDKANNEVSLKVK